MKLYLSCHYVRSGKIDNNDDYNYRLQTILIVCERNQNFRLISTFLD
jgi:hypothetical protein